MDNLRTRILQLVDRLSDIDRQRLHFALANDVPRRIRDDQSLNGTLNLMESLFDQDKISEENFTILINAFRVIKFHEGLKILEDIRRPITSIERYPFSRLTSLNKEIVDDQEDKSAWKSLLNPNNSYTELNTNINPVTINVGTKHILSSFSTERVEGGGGEHHSLNIPWKRNKNLLIIIILLFGLGIVLTILFVNFNRMNCKINEEKRKHDPNFQLLQNTIGERDHSLHQLQQQIVQLQEEKKNLPIRPGQKFGHSINGNHFDDSSLPEFTYSHYLNELVARRDPQGLEIYQFYYYSPYLNSRNIPSLFHGDEQFNYSYKHSFRKSDKIERVEGILVNQTIRTSDGRNVTKSIITSLRFISKEGEDNDYKRSNGISFSESFPNYVLAYVTGKAGQYIEQIQFFWYRT